MDKNKNLQLFVEECKAALSNQLFVKLSLGNYKGNDNQLKNIYIKQILIKDKEFLAFNFRYKTKDLHKNYTPEEGISLVAEYLSKDFWVATLITLGTDFILERRKNGDYFFRQQSNNKKSPPDLQHDRQKRRWIEPEASFLQKLGLSDGKGLIYKHAQDKYRQINKYVEILNGLLKEFAEGQIKQVVDMGSGKGYLTFALYELMTKQQKVEVLGVEYRADLVNLCNEYAQSLQFDGLSFRQGSIANFEQENIDLLIALHACDTATDDAIAKGLSCAAKLIVVAPCCHKQIRKEMELGKAQNELNFLTRHGIFLERQAEMVTDGIRALVLEYFGYKTKVFQFVSDVHTPKNVMLVAIKGKDKSPAEKQQLLDKINSAKSFFGISHHHLEKVLQLHKN